MASKYNIQIKLVSPFLNFPEKELEDIIKNLLLDYEIYGLKFEKNLEIKITKIV